MTVTEFVHLTLPPPHTTTHPSLLAAVTTCSSIMGKASGLPSFFLPDATDATKMYVLGGWPSQEAHQKEFNGSEQQAELIQGVSGVMDIGWMEYLDLAMGVDGMVRGRDGGEIDLRGEGWFVAVVVDLGDWGVERGVLEEGIGKMVESDGVIVARNLKKGEKEGEKDYVVLLKAFSKLEEAEKWGKDAVGAIQGLEKVVSVDAKYFKNS
jgi:hypothetical protein